MGTALVTGASSGIGYELAKCFAADRHDVILVARRMEELERLAGALRDRHGVAARVMPSDLSQTDAPRAIYEQLQSEGVTVDFLVNNAGFGEYGKFADTDWNRESQMILVNVHALTHLTKRFLPDMIRRGAGKILNVASTAAFQPGPWMAVYFATKAYVLSLSEALAHEVRGTGVTVTALCPGPTHSGFQQAAQMHHAGLFHRRAVASSADVARYGYRAMQRGKTVAVPGLVNKLLVQATRIGPRSVVTDIAGQMSRPVKLR